MNRSPFAGRFVFLLYLLLLATRAFSYGPNGHETVGYLADELIAGTPAEIQVKALLGTETLGEAATWADRAKAKHLTDPEMIAFVTANSQHHDYHYTDVPIQETQYVDNTFGTKPVDIEHVMTQCIEVLRGNNNPATNPHGFTPKIALRLLAHFVGDMHQPLHVGAAYFRQVNGKEQLRDPNSVTGCTDDVGGNAINYKPKSTGKTIMLHMYWDDKTVANAMTHAGASTTKQYASFLAASGAVVAQTSGAVTDWPKKWADEMLPISAQAHHGMKFGPRVNGTVFGQPHAVWTVQKTPKNYETWARDTVEERLTTAGNRLAQILHAIWP